MYYTIYQITCKTTGKIYIGKHQTKDLEDGYMGSGKLLKRAQKKHGLENFSKEILNVFETEEEMNNKEAELVTEEFCLREDTYNICPGGKGGWGYNNLHQNSDYKRNLQKLSNEARIRNMQNDPSHKQKYRNSALRNIKKATEVSKLNNPNGAFYGKNHTDEWKKAESERKKLQMKGSGNSQFGTMWITNDIENKKIKKTDAIPEGYRKGRIFGINRI